MKKFSLLQQIGSYIMLIALVSTILHIPEWITYILFFVGFLYTAIPLSIKNVPFQYLLFIIIPILAMFLHLPIPTSLPGLIRIAIVSGFWILMLLLSSYTVQAYTKSK